jgi:hypothetical protein
LGELYYLKKDYKLSEQAFKQALNIRRKLSQKKPQTYLLKAGYTAMNLSILYQDGLSNGKKSLSYAREALLATLFFSDKIELGKYLKNKVIQVLQKWEVEIDKFIIEAQSN